MSGAQTTRPEGLVAQNQTKEDYRRQARAARAALTPEERTAQSQRICHKLSQLIDCCPRPILMLAAFHPMADEPDIWPLLQELVETHPEITVGLPVTREQQQMDFIRITAEETTNPELLPVFLRDPLHAQDSAQIQSREIIEAPALDCMIMPGLAFDHHGKRLGYGAGYYDRYLSREGFRAFKVAVAFDVQLLDAEAALPCAAHDKTVDTLVTASRDLWMST